MYARLVTSRVLEALADTPVVLLHGPRQAGKSTLVRQIAGGDYRATYTTLDDLTPRRAALADPETFVAGLGERAVIDEVQLAPGLFGAIKANVDRDRRPGRFLLTGSADLMLLPTIAESLAGRVERHTLWPLAQAELQGTANQVLEQLFDGEPPRVESKLLRDDYLRLALCGGFPEAVARPAGRRRSQWFGAYLETMVERDVRQLANIHGALELPRLLTAYADRATGLLNYADLGRVLEMERTTVRRYLELLELTFLVRQLPAWHRNVGKRLRKSPKGLFVDTGLMAHLLDVGEPGSATADRRTGPLLENFAVMEVHKLLAAADVNARAYHYRAEDGAEVDLVLERPGGSLVGLEIKASAAVGPGDFAGLRSLQSLTGDDFRAGAVLHSGRQTVAFGERLWAAPLSVLWQSA